jgi:hypothetical protein
MHLNNAKRRSRLKDKLPVVVLVTVVCLMVASPFVLVQKTSEIRIELNIVKAFDFSGSLNNIARKSGFNLAMDPGGTFGLPSIIGSIIYSALVLLGVVFLIVAIVAGYRWMMAGGNEETVARARKTLIRAAVGVLIIMLSYAITYYVLDALL